MFQILFILTCLIIINLLLYNIVYLANLVELYVNIIFLIYVFVLILGIVTLLY